MPHQIPFAKLPIKVIPNSAQNRIVGWLGDKLKVKVTAVAEQGKANKAVEATIAQLLNIQPSHVEICSGHTSTLKIVRINGLTDIQLKEQIDRLL